MTANVYFQIDFWNAKVVMVIFSPEIEAFSELTRLTWYWNKKESTGELWQHDWTNIFSRKISQHKKISSTLCFFDVYDIQIETKSTGNYREEKLLWVVTGVFLAFGTFCEQIRKLSHTVEQRINAQSLPTIDEIINCFKSVFFS